MIEILRWFASATTIVAAILVATNVSAKVSGLGFVVFTVASVAWITIGILDEEPALTIQNIVLTAINLFGVYRYILRHALTGKDPQET